MEQYIPKSALLAEIEKLLDKGKYHDDYDCAYRDGNNAALYALKGHINALEVKEAQENKLPNPRFPHLNNIVDKVFGAGNLESFEYEEAEQLVLLAKEELLKDLEGKEVDLKKEIDDFMAKEWEGIEEKDEPFYGMIKNDLTSVAKHFFELGMAVNNKVKK